MTEDINSAHPSDTPVKPAYAKPQLYAHYFEILKEIAKPFGYNLVIHGSMNRDLDLIAIAWVDNPQDEIRLVQALDHALTKQCFEDKDRTLVERHYMWKVLPGGRSAYVINLNRGGYYVGRNDEGERIYEPDPQYYIDISFAPHFISKYTEQP